MSDMSPIVDSIAHRIQSYRRRIGLTQEELAKKAGVHPTYIGQVERGEKNMTVTSLAKILDALGVSFSEFFDGMNTPAYDVTVATKCYDLVIEQRKGAQDGMYEILKTIDRLMTFYGK